MNPPPPHKPYYQAEADLVESVEQIEESGQSDWRLFLSYATSSSPEPRTATLSAKIRATVHRPTARAFDLLRDEQPENVRAFLFDVVRSLSLRAWPLQAKQAD